MTRNLARWLAGHWLGLSGAPERNRERYYGAATGLRILNFHGLTGAEVERFRRVVDYCGTSFDMAAPEDVDAFLEGRLADSPRDRVLLTFDDGYVEHYDAARWLADTGLRATFFVVPSFLGRTVEEYLRFHAERGVIACDFTTSPASRKGMSVAQVRELVSMGHRIAAHNYAHRDLSPLRVHGDLDYEIGTAVDEVAEITGHACEDFAFAFGHPRFLSDEAIVDLKRRSLRVYSCVRGLNVPGRTPAFLLRDDMVTGYPVALMQACVRGGADHRYAAQREELKRRTGILRGDALRSAAEGRCA
jgi:peptidoglycan/xylan/chitin deacetylase (PgdA/CDA1 family)